MRHGEFCGALGRVNGLNLAEDAALEAEETAVGVGNVGQHGDDEGASRSHLAEALGERNYTLDVVTISC